MKALVFFPDGKQVPLTPDPGKNKAWCSKCYLHPENGGRPTACAIVIKGGTNIGAG